MASTCSDVRVIDEHGNTAQGPEETKCCDVFSLFRLALFEISVVASYSSEFATDLLVLFDLSQC